MDKTILQYKIYNNFKIKTFKVQLIHINKLYNVKNL